MLNPVDIFQRSPYDARMPPNERKAPRVPEGRLTALTSPVRIEVIGALQTAGPCSIRELAGHMGRTPHGLYHHVRVLVAAGVLRVHETRRVGRRDEAVYALTAPRVAGTPDPADPAGRDAVVRAALA